MKQANWTCQNYEFSMTFRFKQINEKLSIDKNEYPEIELLWLEFSFLECSGVFISFLAHLYSQP